MNTTKPKRPTAAQLEPLDPDVIQQEERARIEQQKAAAAPYRVLGWCAERSRAYYQHSQTGQITSIKPAAQPGPLLHLGPIEWWIGSPSPVILRCGRAGHDGVR